MNEEIRRYWSYARQNLRLSDEEFWRLTPSEFGDLMSRFDNEHRRSDFRSALICSVLANINRNPEKKPEPFTVDDFMPGDRAPRSEQSWETQKAIFGAFAEAAKREQKLNG